MNSGDLAALKTWVFDRQKILAQIYRQHGQLSIWDYVASWQAGPSFFAEEPRQQAFFRHVTKLLGPVYGEDAASRITEQIRQNPLVSTIDHHGLLNHPFFVNSNLIFSLRRELKFLPVFSTAGVSLNNSSWPACLVLTDGDGNLRRYSLLPDRLKTLSVWSAPALRPQHIQRLMQALKTDSAAASPLKPQLLSWLEELFSDPVLFQLDGFLPQSSYLTTKLWQGFFPAAGKVVYLPVEQLVNSVLLEEILPDSAHPLNRLLLTQSGQRLIIEYFQNSLGAFSTGHKGSFLFWGLDDKGRRLRLTQVQLSSRMPELKADLSSGKIYPTSLVCFLVLLYYGINCVGGFNQVNWLTEIKQKFTELLSAAGLADLANRVGEVPTRNFAEANLVFLPQKTRLIKATGLDLILNRGADYKFYVQLAKRMSLSQSLESLLPEIYRVITPAGNRMPALNSLTDGEIAVSNGLADLIATAGRV